MWGKIPTKEYIKWLHQCKEAHGLCDNLPNGQIHESQSGLKFHA